MIDPKLVRSKLDACRLHLRRLEPLAKAPFAEFSADYVLHSAAERLIQLVVDTAVDLNNHLLIESGQSVPKDYYGSFIGLVRIKFLSAPLARALARTTGLRNRLVHAYEEIDLAILHSALPALLRDYRQYADRIAARLRP